MVMAGKQKPEQEQKSEPTARKKHSKRRLISALAIISVLAGLYVLFLINVAPRLKPVASFIDPNNPPDKQLIIPKIGVNAPIIADDITKLGEGVIVQRTKSGGDPERGGNFVLIGHRFVMDYTPARIQKKSVLYNLDKLGPGDEIFVYWNHKQHRYRLDRSRSVKPNQIEIEKPSEDTKLTLYTCTLGGTYDGRLVVEALPAD